MSKENRLRDLFIVGLVVSTSACIPSETRGEYHPIPSSVPVPGTPTVVFEEERSFPEQAEDILSSDLAYIYQSAELLKMSEYYRSNEKFKELTDRIFANGKMRINIQSSLPDKTMSSFSDVTYDGGINIGVSLYLETDDKDVYWYLSPVGTVATIAHELTHTDQQNRLIDSLKSRDDLTEEEKKQVYYELRSQEIGLGVWEVQAVWVGLSVFNELEHHNPWIDDRFQNEVFPGELKMVRTQAELEENGENWQSEKWVDTIAEVYGWNDLQVEEINKTIDNYSRSFK